MMSLGQQLGLMNCRVIYNSNTPSREYNKVVNPANGSAEQFLVNETDLACRILFPA